MKIRFVILLVVTIVLCSGQNTSMAQDMTPTPTPAYEKYRLIYEGYIEFGKIHWSPDSQSLFIDDKRYDVTTDDLTQLDTSASVITLTADEQKFYRAFQDTAYISPDGIYMVYLTEFQDEPYWRFLGLADRKHAIYVPLGISVFDSFRVQWSVDSKAFVVEQDTPEGSSALLSFVSRFSGDQTQLFRFNQTLFFGWGGSGQSWEPVFAISSNDSKIMFHYQNDNGNQAALWDANKVKPSDSNPSENNITIDEDGITGAGFIPGDEENVLVIGQRGLMKYNVVTGKSVVLDTEINSEWVYWAYFSPDARYVVVVGHGIRLIPITIR